MYVLSLKTLIFYKNVLKFSVETLSEDEDDPYAGDISESISIRANLFGSPSSGQGYSPAPGGPFSALTPSMWPQDLLATLAQVIIYFRYK